MIKEALPKLVSDLRAPERFEVSLAISKLPGVAADKWELENRGEVAIPDLFLGLDEEDVFQRISAIWGLSWFVRIEDINKANQFSSSEQANEALQKISSKLGDVDSDVRLSALHVIGIISSRYLKEKRIEDFNESIVKQIIHCLDDNDAFVMVQSARLLTRLDKKEGTPVLLTSTHLQDSKIRRRAIHALGLTRGKQSVNRLIEILQGKNKQDGWAAAHSLGRFGGIDASKALLNTLSNGTDLVLRRSCALSLAHLKYKPAIPELTKIIFDPNLLDDFIGQDLIQVSLNSLAMIGGPNVIEILTRAVDYYEDQNLCRVAISSINMVADKFEEKAETLMELLDHHQSDVRGWAAQSISSGLPEVENDELLAEVTKHLISLLDDNTPHIYGRTIATQAAHALHHIDRLEAQEAWEVWKAGLNNEGN